VHVYLQYDVYLFSFVVVFVLFSVVFDAEPSLWWFDSATALVISLLILRESIEAIVASQSASFDGCSCHGEESKLMKWLKARQQEQLIPIPTQPPTNRDQTLK
jgi:hypothetical protein